MLYLVSGTTVYRSSGNGRWEKFYEYPGSGSQSIVSAVLDEASGRFYFLTSTDILGLNLSDHTATSLLTSQGPSSCVGGILGFDADSTILYAACPNGLYRKKGGQDWEVISDAATYVGVDSIAAFSKGADSHVCISSDNGVLCRVNDGSWERVEEAAGVASAPSLERQLSYDPINDRLFVAVKRGSDAAASAGQPVCSLLVRQGSAVLQEPVSLNGDCVESFVVNETTGDLYLTGTSCTLYRYSNGTLTSIGTAGTPLAILPSGGSFCPSSLAINQQSGVLYAPIFERDLEAEECAVDACPVYLVDTVVINVGE